MFSSITPQTSPCFKKGDIIVVIENEIPKYVATYGGMDQEKHKFFPLHSFSHEMNRYRGKPRYTVPANSLVMFNDILKIESVGNEPFMERIHLIKNIDGIDCYYAFIDTMYADQATITPIKMIGTSAASLIGSQVKVPRTRCSPFTGIVEINN